MDVRFLASEWLSIVLVISSVIGLIAILILWLLTEHNSLKSYLVCFVLILLCGICVHYTISIKHILGERYTYIGDVHNLNEESSKFETIIPDTKGYIPANSVPKVILEDLELSEYTIYDRVCFSQKQDKLSFIEFLKGNINYSDWINVTIEESTDYFMLQGKGINIVSDVNVHYGARGGHYYSHTPYIRYNNEFFKLQGQTDWVGMVEPDTTYDIKPETTYIIVYDSLSCDTISDLTGNYTSYNVCTLMEYK